MSAQPDSQEVNEHLRINLPVRAVWIMVCSVSASSIFAAGIYFKIEDIGRKVEQIERATDRWALTIADHERRIVRVETKLENVTPEK